MTHEYVIAQGGAVLGTDEPTPTAIAWAADRVLAVGADQVVGAISRGDSTFIDLGGCTVTAAPSDPRAAEAILRAAIAAGELFDPVGLLGDAGLVDSDGRLEPGSPADLAFWNLAPASVPPTSAASLRIVAVVRAGAFTDGDEHTGPFARTTRSFRPSEGPGPSP